LVRVTDLESGRSVTVTINDRCTDTVGRIIDLSRAAAKELGMHKSTLFRKIKRLGIDLPEIDGRSKKTNRIRTNAGSQ